MKDRMCECVEDLHKHDGVCGSHPYSWSTEHDNAVLCVKCYLDFLKNRDTIKALKAIEAIAKSPEAKAKLREMLK